MECNVNHLACMPTVRPLWFYRLLILLKKDRFILLLGAESGVNSQGYWHKPDNAPSPLSRFMQPAPDTLPGPVDFHHCNAHAHAHALALWGCLSDVAWGKVRRC